MRHDAIEVAALVRAEAEAVTGGARAKWIAGHLQKSDVARRLLHLAA